MEDLANSSSSSSSVLPDQTSQRFTFAEIQSATNNFDETLVISHGGFGKVYRCRIKIGSVSEVAVKRLHSMSNQGAHEFEAEIQICIGAARGLDYLHVGTSTQHGIIHRDVKSSNILLDENLDAKIADFGLAKIGLIDRTHVSTAVKGTFDYMDPSYFYTGKLTTSSDVYAFGVVLFEVLTGKKAVDSTLDEERWSLAAWALHQIKVGKLNNIIDQRLIGQISKKCLKEFARIAGRCLHAQPKKRPSMAEVVFKLESILSQERERSNSVVDEEGLVYKLRSLFTGKVDTEIRTDSNYGFRTFTYRELRSATNGFKYKEHSPTFYKHSYKGWIDERTYAPTEHGVGLAIYVTKMMMFPTLTMDFKLEEFNHPNLVKLLGYCLNTRELFCVYEVISGITLDRYLYGGAAEGIIYLHKRNKPTYTQFKTNFILVDTDFNARLSDYVSDPDVFQFVEAYYTSPKWFRYLADTFDSIYRRRPPPEGFVVKSEIYGFGVVLLEILIGLKVYDEERPLKKKKLVTWAIPLLPDEGNLGMIMDPQLQHDDFPPIGAFKLAQLVSNCLEQKQDKCPSMEEILQVLHHCYQEEVKAEVMGDHTAGKQFGAGRSEDTTIKEATKIMLPAPIKNTNSSSSSVLPDQRCQHFTVAEIKLATNNFDKSLVIGRGGFGKVYKGRIKIGSVSEGAIKRLRSNSSQGAHEFEAEIQVLSKLRHGNLVSLISFCKKGNKMALVYEFMPSGTLEEKLHKPDSFLSVLQRLKICIGAARGLHYLHTCTSTQHGVIHRDVKSSNILLDANFDAKIADFGLARFGKKAVDSTLDEEQWGLVLDPASKKPSQASISPEKPFRRRRRHCSAGDSPEKTNDVISDVSMTSSLTRLSENYILVPVLQKISFLVPPVSTITMVRLTPTNYNMWKPMMEDLLYLKDLAEPLEKKGVKPDTKTDDVWMRINKKTVAQIRQWIDHSVFHHVSQETDAYKLWEKLENMYQAKTARNKTLLMRRLVNHKLRSGTSITEHTSQFQDLVNQLGAAEWVLKDEEQAILLLSSLPDNWETLVVTLSNSAPGGKVTMEMNTKEDVKIEPEVEDEVEAEADVVKVEEDPKIEGNRESESDCRKLLREQSETSQSSSRDDGETLVTISQGITLVACENEACLHVGAQYDEWVIDTAASYHATPDQDLFATYKSGDHGTVKMGNTSSSSIAGIGDHVHIKTKVGCTLVLKDVRHVPDLRMNLISVGALDRQGYDNQFGDGTWKLLKGVLVVARGQLYGTLYKTHAKLLQPSLNAVKEETSPNLWHKRLGHMSVKGLTTLEKKKYISIAKDVALDPCEYCIFGKQHRVSFSSTRTKRSELLSLVHSDVCEPIEVESLGGCRYFVTFIEDASQKVWAYCIGLKDQVFDRFKAFHAMVERQKRRKLKCLRSDNGGEYCSREFSKYCTEHGIRHEKIVPRTPQHNGVAERMNRTIVEKVRCMLSMAKLSKPLWGEAVLTACYLINRSPSVPLNFEVPEKIWTGKYISYSHLRVFGCKAFAHVSSELRKKLDLKSTPCIFIGYGDEEFGYKLWDPELKKVIRSKDVVFYENQYYDSKSSVSEQQSSTVSEPISETNEDVPIEENVDEVEDVNQEGVEQGELPPLDTSDPLPEDASEGEPESFQEAQSHSDKGKWQKAMEEEMNSLQKNQTYELVKLPKGKKALKNKWVFKLKKNGKGNTTKYKARLVVKGFQQKEGIDFDEIFSPVVKMMSIRVVLGLVASLDLEIEQMDVKTSFLHGDLDEEIYMEQPEGFHVTKKEHLVCKLKKSLYGLKQAPRQWYKKFDSFMTSHEYKRTDADHCVYLKKFPDGKFVIILLYVDDMLIVGQDATMIDNLKKDLSKFFDMKDLGPAQQILGMKITRDRKARKLFLSQEEYVERVIKRFNMENAKPVGTPLANHFKLSKRNCPSSKKEKEEMKGVPYTSAVGSLMYVMVCTRPDIAQAVGVVSRYLANPGKQHWEAVKWILRYLNGTSKLRLCYGGANPILEGYTDADMSGDLDNMKCTSKAEYIAAVEAGKELIWLKRFLRELGFPQREYIIHCDSQGRPRYCAICAQAQGIIIKGASKYYQRLGNQNTRETRNIEESKLEKFQFLSGANLDSKAGLQLRIRFKSISGLGKAISTKEVYGVQPHKGRLLVKKDNQSAMDLSKNSMYHSRTKHIDVRYHWLRQAIEEGELKLSKIDTNYNPADMLTKVVTQDKHKLCTDIVRLRIVERRLEGDICWIQPPRSQVKLPCEASKKPKSKTPIKVDALTRIITKQSLKTFTYDELASATNGFKHIENSPTLNEYIYKAWVDKRTYAPTEYGFGLAIYVRKMQFMITEMEIKVEDNKHPNHLKLLGYCSTNRVMFCVYKVNSGMTLDKYLYGGGTSISWVARLKIAKGAVEGLFYLHKTNQPAYRQFKTNLILVDMDFNARLSGFAFDPHMLQLYAYYAAPEWLCYQADTFDGVRRGQQPEDGIFFLFLLFSFKELVP
ncbi:hypothetical protein LXL04_006896 [Taraxacum kok-saghyz]